MPTKTFNEPTKEKLKRVSKLIFNLIFTATKVLAYIVVAMGFWLSILLKSESPFVVAVGAATLLMGVKAVTDSNTTIKTSNTPSNPPE